MKILKKYLPYILFGILVFFSIFLWSFLYKQDQHTDLLTVAFLDIGQGDAIYIEAPNGKQMLVDGGPDIKILQRLGEVMPFGDRSIDVVIATHADADHIGGLPFVLNKYKVDSVIENGANSNSLVYKSFEKEIQKKKINKTIANNKMRIMLDKEKNIYFDFLFPDRDTSHMVSNDGSIVGKLVYRDESFMLTGDATLYTENQIEWNESSDTIHAQVLKLGHHGSHTSSSLLWLKEVDPEVAIVSAGKHNRYGHPHKEVLDRLNSLHIPYLETSKEGNIIFYTDGLHLIYK